MSSREDYKWTDESKNLKEGLPPNHKREPTMTTDNKSIDEIAREYADKKVPNANANDAPYYTTGDRWEDIKEAYLAGSASKRQRKIVCYCGSLRVAMDAFKKAEYEAVLKGEIALLPCCMFVDIEREYGAESDYKQKADDLHKRKIDICDEVFVLNVGGYIGQSTRSEIDYALSIGKPVKYLQ